MRTITTAELEESLDEYLDMVARGETIIMTRDDEEILEMHPIESSKVAVFESLIGIAKGVDPEKAKEERLSAK